MIHMVTGGSGSGKSAYAEDWLLCHRSRPQGYKEAQESQCLQYSEEEAENRLPLLYIATMIPYGEEAKKKIERHHHLREGKGFVTLERYTDLKRLEIPANAGILLECVSNLAANEFYRDDGTMKERKETLERIIEGIRHLSGRTACLTIVTNEVFADINGYSHETEEYRELLGMVNQRIAVFSDRVTEVVYGIPVCIKNNEQSME